MLLKTLKLHNIRSYTSATIEFPTGIVMLSGDIGAGKSTILLAIEFALFGILRGELSANALLRNGAQQGSVELTFKIDKEHTIKRTLTRTKNTVEQGAGYIITNGIKTDKTATELKSTILELLNYPPELITKGKNYVYRYTIYTPQEDMKKIILEDKEERVQILRKVFNIDKYERITQNATNYTKTLRERQRANTALTTDIEEKKKQKENTEQEITLAKKQIEQITPELIKIRQELNEVKKTITLIEQQKQQQEITTREIHATKSLVLAKKQQHQQTTNDLTTTSEQAIKAQQELPQQNPTDLTSKNTEITQKLQQKEKDIRQIMQKITELNTHKKLAQDTTQKITTLAQCPTCLQNVTQEHKHQITNTQRIKIEELEKELSQHTITIKETEQQLEQHKKEQEQLRQQEKETAIIKVKIMHAEQLIKRKGMLEQQTNNILIEITNAEQKLTQLEQQIKPEINTIYESVRKEFEQKTQQERTQSIQHSTLTQKEQLLTKELTKLQEELNKKHKIKEQLEKTQKINQWLTDYFAPLMNTIEKHVMNKIHHEFNTLFQQWFAMLIEDTMTARLDENFTPIIQQNGYEIEVEHLSGGERTACALAYRLALNKTINSIMNNIKTKDLLILDEPTDGFSTEQLDKMRDVLDQLHLGQIIIVSHEQKIESYADKIIRVTKTEHTSQII